MGLIHKLAESFDIICTKCFNSLKSSLILEDSMMCPLPVDLILNDRFIREIGLFIEITKSLDIKNGLKICKSLFRFTSSVIICRTGKCMLSLGVGASALIIFKVERKILLLHG